MGKNNMLSRTCKECGNAFLGGPRAWYCPECREKRRIEADRRFKARRRAGDVVPLGSVIKCEICGKEIVKNGGLQKFCEECASKHLKAIDNAQSLRWKRDNMDKIRESKRAFSKRRHAEDEQLQSGIPGVSWDKGARRWRATITLQSKQYTVIKTQYKWRAIAARKEAENLKKYGMLTADKIEEIKNEYRDR